jgi:hypothetical protein
VGAGADDVGEAADDEGAAADDAGEFGVDCGADDEVAGEVAEAESDDSREVVEGDAVEIEPQLGTLIRAIGVPRTIELLLKRIPDGASGAATARNCLRAMGSAAEQGVADIEGSKKMIRTTLSSHAGETMSERSFRDAYKLLQQHVGPLFEELGRRRHVVRLSRLRGDGW